MVGMKVLFRRSDGKVMGDQALSRDAQPVDKRISALAMAIQNYAPQFGSAKDPVNFAGMIARDRQDGDMAAVDWDAGKDGLLLDAREPVELALETVPGALNIPLGEAIRDDAGEGGWQISRKPIQFSQLVQHRRPDLLPPVRMEMRAPGDGRHRQVAGWP